MVPSSIEDIPFTVVIPTRDRCSTLKATIETCLMQEYRNLRVVVSDNCSTDDTRAVVDGFSDPRLSYQRTGRRLSMAGNFEFSLDFAQTGYLMQLGDDDGLLPDAIVRLASMVRETGAKAITSSMCVYLWPDSLNVGARNHLIFSTRKGYETRDTTGIIRDVVTFRKPFQELPSTYYGFVHTDVINAARRGGRYYHSRTPDSYSGFVNAAQMPSYLYSFTPFSMIGSSGRSNGASQTSDVDGREAALFEAESDIALHPALKYAGCNEMIVAEAFLQACNGASSLKGVELDLDLVTRMALARAPASKAAEIGAAVAETRAMAGLKPADGDWKQRAIKALDRARKVRVRAERARRRYQNIDASLFGVVNIAAASRLAGYKIASRQNGYDSPAAHLVSALTKGW